VISDELRGARFLIAEFRVLVNVSAPSNQLGFDRCGTFAHLCFERAAIRTQLTRAKQGCCHNENNKCERRCEFHFGMGLRLGSGCVVILRGGCVGADEVRRAGGMNFEARVAGDEPRVAAVEKPTPEPSQQDLHAIAEADEEGNVDAVWKFIRKQKRVVVWVKFSPRSNRNMCSNVQI